MEAIYDLAAISVDREGEIAIHGMLEVMVFGSEQLQWVAIVEDQQDRWLPFIRRRSNLFARPLDPLPNFFTYRPGVDWLLFEGRVLRQLFDFEDQSGTRDHHLVIRRFPCASRNRPERDSTCRQEALEHGFRLGPERHLGFHHLVRLTYETGANWPSCAFTISHSPGASQLLPDDGLWEAGWP